MNGSWFEIHYNDRAIPETFFRQQLRMSRATFDTVVNILGPRIVRENSILVYVLQKYLLLDCIV